MKLTQDEWLIILVVGLMAGVYVIITLKRNYTAYHDRKARLEQADKVVVEPKTNALAKAVTDAAPDVIGYPKPAGKGVKNVVPDDDMIAKYYNEGTECVPMQYPKLPIGACPFSKPQSKALPIANVPMCVSTGNGDMVLGSS